MRKYPAHIELYTGPMYSGKSTSLKEKFVELSEAGKETCYYRFTLEKLTNSKKSSWTTHGGIQINGYLINSFAQIDEHCPYLFIDEVQFAFFHCFDEDSDGEKEKFFALSADKHIYLAGLNLDWQDMPFLNSTGFFMSLANKINVLMARCHRCDADAQFSEKITKDRRRFDEMAEYFPICRDCRIANSVAVATEI